MSLLLWIHVFTNYIIIVKKSSQNEIVNLLYQCVLKYQSSDGFHLKWEIKNNVNKYMLRAEHFCTID